MKRRYSLNYEINGGEYSGSLGVTCEVLVQQDARTFIADAVVIELDEDVIEVKRWVRGHWWMYRPKQERRAPSET